MKKIRIAGARTHNLQNIDVEFPRDKLVVVTGLSGSGKSSLAFDTLFAEGQRRYMESLSAYARQFLTRVDKPDVDRIEGLSPTISIEQKSASHNPRSTVGTVTEIHDYLRLLYARAGSPRCPTHGRGLEPETVSQMVDRLQRLCAGQRILLLAPVVRARKGEHRQLLEQLRRQGFLRARIDGAVCELEEPPPADPKKKHSIEVVVDRLRVGPDAAQRLAESFETALELAGGLALAAPYDADDGGGEDIVFSSRFACPHCGFSVGELKPQLFSFNSPAGACARCDGLGAVQSFDEDKIVRDARLSIADGALRGWDRRNKFRYQMLRAFARRRRFRLDQPFASLPAATRQLIIHGPPPGAARGATFDGIAPYLRRRMLDTDSELVREEARALLSAQPCPECRGARLNEAARHVFVGETSLPALADMTIAQALEFLARLRLPGGKAQIAARIVAEIGGRLGFLNDVGLGYLTLGRSAETLSGGEAQRIRLASQIGSGLVGVLYVLDEPTIGLHQRDNARLLATLTRLRDLGNTVVVVEHDETAIRAADHVIDVGPGAGRHGGHVVAQGTPRQIERHPRSLTGAYLSGRRRIETPPERARPDGRSIRARGLRGNNLKNIDVEIPLGLFVCVTGVSGSGKSTLVNETLYKHIARRLHRHPATPAPCRRIDGLQHIDHVIDIDQSPIGRTPRSNPATYTGLFTPLRELFALTPEARARAYRPGRFSFNVRGGRCEACQGDGVLRVEMHFLPDVYVRCDVCQGRRYNRETLDIRYKGRNIHETLEMSVEEALAFFGAVPVVRRRLETLSDVGLGYISLGQNAVTLSGGEAQRIKLSRELSKRDTGRTLYILDEPTTGLHFHDVRQLLEVLHRLSDAGNTVVVIEHNLDVIRTADWVIDLGPEGGDAGGQVVAAGAPEEVARVAASHTGRALAEAL